MGIHRIVSQLTRRHGSNNPFIIAAQRNILVLFEPLGGIMGYFNTYKRIPMIHINNRLSEMDQRFTCSHELGHAILHPKLNTPFLRRHTLVSIDRIEREANEFAAELMIPDELLLDGRSLVDIAKENGVPWEIALLKRPSAMKRFFRDEQSFLRI
ncbi:ImmA/IrrE family metallo-endopeptidase [Paenibacillus humicola]|uniref:ImmA/IrrE family metallo-endopeptidase n=1 Tax=Paenibacillus humicola TaxID=3110540 RepID=UPI00237C0283|nr:ImmA/IrrE family metallo-endopeptidase [Paenibacillus humicola]